MRFPVHDSTVRFRVNQTLLAAAAAKAEREGMSLSELMRAAVRRAVKEAA